MPSDPRIDRLVEAARVFECYAVVGSAKTISPAEVKCDRCCLSAAISAVTGREWVEANAYVDVILTKGPGPHSQFVACEYPFGTSINAGEWREDGRGYAVLRIQRCHPIPKADSGPNAKCAASAREGSR